MDYDNTEAAIDLLSDLADAICLLVVEHYELKNVMAERDRYQKLYSESVDAAIRTSGGFVKVAVAGNVISMKEPKA